MSIITYPLDGKYYNAQDAETYLCTRTSGVFSEEISFTPNGMNITVSPFLAWIKNDDFSGKSVAVTTATTLTIPPSEPVLSRIDMIVLRFDARKNSSELMVLKGTPSSSPSRPSIERTPVVYDLGLCQILVKPSATSISASNITSTLLDESLCGIMSDGVTRIPTSTLQSQVVGLIKELEAAVSMAENGSPVLQGLGIKQGTVDVTIGTKGQKIYKSDDVKFDTIFVDTPSVIVTRRYHSLNKTVFGYIKPQESVRYTIGGFYLDVFSEKDLPTEYNLRYNWIAIGKVYWDNNGGGGGDDGGDEEDDTEYFTISTNVEPSGSGTTEGAGNFAKGSTTKLVARASSGYTFEGWYLGNSKEASTAQYIVTVNSNATYTAKFIEEDPSIEDSIDVKINVEPAAAGNVTGAGTYPKGSTVNLKATPKNGYKFVGWYALDRLYSDSADYSVTLNGSITFTAVFEADTVTPGYYTITTEVTPENGGTVTGGGTYEEDTVVTLKATPNNGYYFLYWTNGTETRQTETTEVYATSDQTWTAVFEEDSGGEETTYTITTRVEPSGAGTVTGGGTYEEDTVVTLKATPNNGYYFLYWTNGTETRQTETTEVYATSDQTWTAVFEAEHLVITISPEGAGEVTITEGETYEWGTTKTLEAIPASGYKFSHWLLANTTEYTENPHQIIMKEDTYYAFKAVFVKDTTTEKKTITFSASSGTTKVVCDGVELSNSKNNFTHEFDIGDEVTLTFTPDSGKAFESWVNNDTVSTLSRDNPWTFTVDSSTVTKIGIVYIET